MQAKIQLLSTFKEGLLAYTISIEYYIIIKKVRKMCNW